LSRTIVVFVSNQPDLTALMDHLGKSELSVENGDDAGTKLLRCGAANDTNDNLILVDGPYRCGPHDFENHEGTEFGAYLDASGWLVEITVPAVSTERTNEIALELGQKFSTDYIGVLADDWSDGLWPSRPKIKKKRKQLKVRQRVVDVVSFVWFFALSNSVRLREEQAMDIHDKLIKFLRSAPISSTPLPSNVFRIDERKVNLSWEDFSEQWHRMAKSDYGGTDRFHIKPPLIDFRIEFSDPRQGLKSPKNRLNYIRLDLNFERSAFVNRKSAETLLQTFSELSDALPTIYASSFLFEKAEMEGSWMSTHRDIHAEPSLTIFKGWTGLPEDTGWMFWLPKSYDQRILADYPNGQAQRTSTGILFRLSEKPSLSEAVKEHRPALPSDLYFEASKVSWQSKAASQIPTYEALQQDF